jgi:hypothetical protein
MQKQPCCVVQSGSEFLISSAEFLERFEASGSKLAGSLTPIAYILRSLWLVAIGAAFQA